MYKVRLRFEKEGTARFISHLDLMQVFQRSFSRAAIPLWQTEGFNRHAYVSIALPMPVGVTGRSEFLEFGLNGEEIPPELTDRLNRALPPGIRAIEAYPAVRPVKEMAFGLYRIGISAPGGMSDEQRERAETLLSNHETRLIKKSKSGEKEVALRDFLLGEPAWEPSDGGLAVTLRLGVGQESLSPLAVTRMLKERIPDAKNWDFAVERTEILDAKGEIFR